MEFANIIHLCDRVGSNITQEGLHRQIETGRIRSDCLLLVRPCWRLVPQLLLQSSFDVNGNEYGDATLGLCMDMGRFSATGHTMGNFQPALLSMIGDD